MNWEWSSQVDEADWIAARQPAAEWVCTVPTGFAAYARLLHPIEPLDPAAENEGSVRWAQVAHWSGMPLGPRTQFWQLALPEQLPLGPPPGQGEPPSDVLGEHDGQSLAGLLRQFTTTPQECWFGIWDGYGWDGTAGAYVQGGNPADFSVPLTGPVPTTVLAGPRVRLPGRDYLLYSGPVEAGLAFLPEQYELADLWWPSDRAWFVYGDVDLNATYVAGSTALIEALLASAEVEALAVEPDDPVVTGPGEVPCWLARLVEGAVCQLIDNRRSQLTTSRFTARFELVRRPWRSWWLNYVCDDPAQTSGGTSLNGKDLPRQLHDEIMQVVTSHLEE